MNKLRQRWLALPPASTGQQLPLWERIGLKEPMLGQEMTSTVCFTAVRP